MKRKGWGVLAAFSALLALVAAFALPVSARAAVGDVARIGDVTYAALDEAIAAAEEGRPSSFWAMRVSIRALISR